MAAGAELGSEAINASDTFFRLSLVVPSLIGARRAGAKRRSTLAGFGAIGGSNSTPAARVDHGRAIARVLSGRNPQPYDDRGMQKGVGRHF